MSSIEQQTITIEETIEGFEKTIEEILSPEFTENLSSLDPMDRCQLEVMLSYLINNTLWSYMMIKGLDVKSHPILNELERVKLYIERIRELQGKSKPKVKVNVEASKRVISHSLAGNEGAEGENAPKKTKQSEPKEKRNGQKKDHLDSKDKKQKQDSRNGKSKSKQTTKKR